MRLKAWILLACIPLLGLAGCDVFLAVPLQVTPTTQTVAIDEGVGHATATWTLHGKGIIAINFGEGLRETIELQAEINRTITHTYALIGTYPVTFTQGRTVQHAEVTVTCVMPKVAPPFFLNALVDDGERVTFNFTRRDVGCMSSSGKPLYYAGIEQGSGRTEFRVTAYLVGGEPISIFDETGRNVWGEWIALKTDRRELQLLTIWAGWSGPRPLIPMDAIARVGPMDCGETCPDLPWEPPTIPGDAGLMTFTLAVRNQYMPPQSYVAVPWMVGIQSDDCG